MATYDLLMLAILVGLTLYGYFKGMAWQIAYIASFVVSYFVATRFADRIAPSITFVNPPANKFVAMLLIYIACSFAVWTLFRLVSKMIDSVKMEGFDHQMGALIGFFRGVLWCVGVTFFAVTLLPAAQKQQIIASRSGHYIARLVDETDSLFPPEVHQVVGPYLNRLGNELQGNGSQNAPLPALPGFGQAAPQTAPQQPSGFNQLLSGAVSGAADAWGRQAPAGQQPAAQGWPQPTGAAPPAASPSWFQQTPASQPPAAPVSFPQSPGPTAQQPSANQWPAPNPNWR
ncbi:MAG: CvpA family protein [Lacipirellulaceae bacterium]